jgi:hypothetical protein
VTSAIRLFQASFTSEQMIVALFLLHVSSVFLPFSQTNQPSIPYLTDGFIESFEPTSQSLEG